MAISGNVGQNNWVQNPLANQIQQQPPVQVGKSVDQSASPKDLRASGGVMSGSELVEAMGKKPTINISLGGHVFKANSTAYKATLESVKDYQSNLKNLSGIGLDGVSKQEIAQLKSNLNDIMTHCDEYAQKHAGDPKKQGQLSAMASLKAMAQSELALLDKLGDLKNTKGKDVGVPEGLALLRGGVTDCSGYNSHLNDNTMDKNSINANFGSGKANSVALVTYGNNDTRVLKGISKEASKLMAGESTTGFDQQDMRTGARNMATSNVAQELGIGSSLPKPDIVICNGDAAVAMHPAKGESLIKKYETPVTDKKDIDKYDKELKMGWHDNLKNYGVRKDDNGVWQKTEVGFKDLPYTGTANPPLTASLQKGLLDLQTADCLMAQMDRQPENIFIQIKGNQAHVTGIDNDMCMGPGMKKLDALDDGVPLRVDLKSTYGGPPPLMSREMFNKLNALTEDKFKESLGPEFTKDEVDAAVGRLKLLKEHADTLNKAGFVVDNFETWTGKDPKTGVTMNASDFMMASDLRSYVKRDATTLGKTKTPMPLDMSKH